MKKNKLLIIILSATLVLIGATFAILYFTTDIFKKSNNEILKVMMQQKAEKALPEAKENMVYEAIQLAKAEIEANIRIEGIGVLDEITEELIAEKIEYYLPSSYNINVIKTEGKLEFTVLVDDIELDGIRNKLDFSSFEEFED